MQQIRNEVMLAAVDVLGLGNTPAKSVLPLLALRMVLQGLAKAFPEVPQDLQLETS